MSALNQYLQKTAGTDLDPGMVAYVANLEKTAQVAPEIAASIVNELEDQRSKLKLIASENYCSLSTQLTMGNLLTDKYAEGFPYSRFYEGCHNIDIIEASAAQKACDLFGADHAYVQAHSGADANMVAFWGILNARIGTPALEALGVKNPMAISQQEWNSIRSALGNQRLLGLDLAAGGHLTHGYRFNVSGKMFDAYSYGVSEEDHLLDYDAIEAQAREIQPLIILAGYSAYPRKINFKRFREIADAVGAVLMVDMAHFAGLVAGKVFTGDYNPVPHAHVVTSTTHKTLRGPRGGLVLSTKEFAPHMDKGCPLVLGGPLSHVMAAKAVAFTEALQPEFQNYAQSIVDNASHFAHTCMKQGIEVVSGGTDNHLFLINTRASFDLTGRQAAAALAECGITLNKNAIPFDPLSPMITSGLRIGTAAITSLGMGTTEMEEITDIIAYILKNTSPGVVQSGKNAGKPSKIEYELPAEVQTTAQKRVSTLLSQFVLYPELDLQFLKEAFGA
ncbi:glycine hydroxymethyltransferase [Chitinivibrio alkaliphilus]|uniref:Serine hydroxymethyltransferase n=1 Tax=Chitinivibrio alkaliphilus ACht1 TaxID=1313304 RepID=U7D908_9BACT|nr:glycine hydroxymethyltransferase [Chitinivibrio alkaliphilus]ERP30880.1 Serine-glycine hydroxymethyltransferase [Chitinivibrio alkaliphilus ACht1]